MHPFDSRDETENSLSDTSVHPFVTPLGGVMTREVGAISGDVEAWLDEADAETVRIRYAGAQDVYTVKGKAHGRSIDQVVEALAADPGNGEDGNPRSTDLTEAGGAR